MRCPVCNAENAGSGAFCGQCGAPLREPAEGYAAADPGLLEESAADNDERISFKVDGSGQRARETDVYKPLSTLSCIWMLIVMMIPVLNVVMVLWWAFSRYTNRNKRHFAAAVIILWTLIICGGAAAYALVPDVRIVVDNAFSYAVNWLRENGVSLAAGNALSRFGLRNL